MNNRFFVLHLSDIHIKGPEDLGALQPAAIAAALRPLVEGGADVLVAVTGDVAFSGKAEEYSAGTRFFAELRDEIRNSTTGAVTYAIVPGNHDVDFSKESGVHGIVRSAALAKAETVDRSVTELLLGLQDAFFTFEADVSGASVENRLYYVRTVEAQNHRIVVHCFNTAWMSRLKEKQGELLFPHNTAITNDEPADLSIALFHHPYGWLEASNSRTFRQKIEQAADIVLTGHEHAIGAFERRDLVGAASTYVEGAVLHGDPQAVGGFNLIEVDFGAKRFRVHPYAQGANAYSAKLADPPWQVFMASKSRLAGEPVLRPEFEAYLHDAGAPFTHGYKTKLTLDDVWVDVELEDRSFGRDIDAVGTCSSAELFSPDSPTERIMVAGADDSGKTSLMKHVYLRNHAAGKLPLLISGGAFRSADRDHVTKVLRQCIAEQYGDGAADRYLQKNPSDKMLIVDDFDEAPLNNRGQNELLEVMHEHFTRVILTVSDLFAIERLVDTGDERRPLVSYSIVQIRELGHRQRGELIERWLTLGREQTISEEDLVYAVTQTERNIDTLLGKGLFPAYPMFVLGVLQTIEATSSLNTAELGTYGHVYDALIASKLTAHLRGLSTDTKYTFLAELAFRVGDRTSFAVTTTELYELGDEFFLKYKIRIPIEDLLSEMANATILQQSGDDVSFKYKYVLYYFIAKYYALNLLDKSLKDDLRRRIKKLVEESHTEHAANVLLFLLYLTKDPDVIDEMLIKVRSVFGGREPARFDADVSFLGEMAGSPIRLELPSLSGKEGVEERRVRRDAKDARKTREDVLAETEYDLLQLNAAMKAIQILGQVLRNFPGSLPATTKAAAAQEVYAVGLRSVTAVLVTLAEHLPELRVDIARVLRQRRNISDERLSTKTDQFLFNLTVLFGYGMLKRVSFALGSEHLTETYKDVLASSDTNAVALVDMTIKLDHFRALPLSELEELGTRLHKSLYATSVLRRLVWDRLYFFPVPYKVKQKLCGLFEIHLSPRFHNKDRKRLLSR